MAPPTPVPPRSQMICRSKGAGREPAPLGPPRCWLPGAGCGRTPHPSVHHANGPGHRRLPFDRGREEVLPEPVPGEGPGFTHQGPDDVPVVDAGMLSPHPLQTRVFVGPQIVGVLVNFHLVAAQPGGYQTRMVLHFLTLVRHVVYSGTAAWERSKIGPLYI